MKLPVCIILLLCITQMLSAQTKTLPKEGIVFGSPTNDVTQATIQAETEKTVSVQAEYRGFNEKGKSYKMTATILNQLKKPIKEIMPITLDMDAGGGLIDFTFNFTQRPGIQYSPEGIKSSYIEFSVAEKKPENLLFNDDVLGLGVTKFTFQFKKNWKVKVPLVVTVKLVPYKNAPTN
jgi:hypothetical protein